MIEIIIRRELPKGHIPDRPCSSDVGLRSMPGLDTSSSWPSAVDYTPFVDQIRTQVGSSCVGNAFARAIHLRAAVQGPRIPYPSSMAIYTLARSKMAAASGGPLVDEGSNPRSAAESIAQDGVPRDADWPQSDDTLMTPLPWDMVQRASDFKVNGYYRVFETGSDRCDAVRLALSKGFIPVFATLVDEQFEEDPGELYTGLKGPSLGSHMLALAAYAPGKLKLVNSWGDTWGLGGYAWLSDEFFGSDACSDVWVIDAVPAMVNA